MTERPTEQTQGRVTQAEPRPVLPPMPHDDAANGSGGTSLSERLQQKLSSVREALPTSSPAPASNGATNGAATDTTTVRPAVREERPAAAPAPIPTSPAAPTQRAERTQRTRTVRASRQRKPPRRARLRLTRVDPWSVMKTAFMFSIAGGIMLVVGVYAVWTVISGSGLFDNINSVVAAVVSTPGDTTPFRVEDYVNTPKVMGITAFIACIDVVIITALATLGGFLYNLAATMLGGLEITLAED